MSAYRGRTGGGHAGAVRAARLLTMAMLLQTRPLVSARELAQRLEVSERTVQRDVAELVAAGIPVVAVRGPAGGYRIADGYRHRTSGLSAAEAEAVTFLGLTGVASDLGFADVVGGAQLKLLAGTTPEGRERARRVASRFHLDTDRWFGTAEPAPALVALARAVWDDRRVRVRHHRRTGERTERVLDPLGLVLKGEWYLLAAREGELRTYRVSRLEAVQVLAEAARRPASFDLQQAWGAHLACVQAGREELVVRVRAHPRALPGLRRVASAAAQPHLPVVADGLPVDAAGRVELAVAFDARSWAVSTLLGLAPDVEVLAPADVRAEVARRARAAAAQHAGPPPGPLGDGAVLDLPVDGRGEVDGGVVRVAGGGVDDLPLAGGGGGAVVAGEEPVRQAGDRAADQGREPEQPELLQRRAPGEQGRAGGARGVHRGVRHGDAHQVDQGQGQPDGQRPEALRGAPVGGAEDDEQEETRQDDLGDQRRRQRVPAG
ncbi:WYL domain-containing protein [Kineococcus sp. T90]|nr:WYL domain-containing protein [Kineococcus indalonis]